jgi:hypothetical protein
VATKEVRHEKAEGGEMMVELLAEIEMLRKRMDETREKLGPVTEIQEFESRVRSVYASLAIEDPNVTIEEVREVLLHRAAD